MENFPLMTLFCMDKMNISKIECPGCRSKDNLKVLPKSERASQMAILIGGVVLPTLWIYGRQTKLTCESCGKVFGFRTLAAKLSITLFWLFIALLLITGVLFNLMIN